MFDLKLEEPRALLYALLSAANDALTRGKRVYISFRKTKKLLPSGTLYFLAHVETMFERYPSKLMVDYPTDDVVHQLFEHVGLLRRMGLSKAISITAENVKHWHIARGTTTDVGDFEQLRKEYWDTLGPQLGMTLGGSMGEAVTNCVQHAYMDVSGATVRWWMFAEYRDQQLTVAIFDIGVGIVGSLRSKPNLVDTIRKRFGRPPKHDRRLLQLAVGSRLTRTKLDHRGKGLPEMLENAHGFESGGLLILCNHAAFVFDSKTGVEASKAFNQPLQGTLVQWSIPIAEET